MADISIKKHKKAFRFYNQHLFFLPIRFDYFIESVSTQNLQDLFSLEVEVSKKLHKRIFCKLSILIRQKLVNLLPYFKF